MASPGRLQRIIHHASAYARLRIELLKADVESERAQLLQALLRSTVIALSLLLVAQLLFAALIVLAWNTRWRLPLMLGLPLLPLALAAWQWRALSNMPDDRHDAAEAAGSSAPRPTTAEEENTS